ncbi:hypothetical protein MC885_011921, partial [Smutsia gigantea]
VFQDQLLDRDWLSVNLGSATLGSHFPGRILAVELTASESSGEKAHSPQGYVGGANCGLGGGHLRG